MSPVRHPRAFLTPNTKELGGVGNQIGLIWGAKNFVTHCQFLDSWEGLGRDHHHFIVCFQTPVGRSWDEITATSLYVSKRQLGGSWDLLGRELGPIAVCFQTSVGRELGSTSLSVSRRQLGGSLEQSRVGRRYTNNLIY